LLGKSVFSFGPINREEPRITLWAKACDAIYSGFLEEDFGSKIEAMKRLLSGDCSGPKTSLECCNPSVCHLDCEDPRNKIFGLVGIVHKRDVLVVDYAASLDMRLRGDFCIHMAASIGTRTTAAESNWHDMLTALECLSNELSRLSRPSSSYLQEPGILRFRNVCNWAYCPEGASELERYLDASARDRLSCGLVTLRGQQYA
jgi:hypothetical protein